MLSFLCSLSVIFIRILYFLLYCIVYFVFLIVLYCVFFISDCIVLCILYFWSGHTTRSFLVSSFTCGPISQDGLAQFVRRPEWSSIYLLHRFLFETNKRENITRTDPCQSLVFIVWRSLRLSRCHDLGFSVAKHIIILKRHVLSYCFIAIFTLFVN